MRYLTLLLAAMLLASALLMTVVSGQGPGATPKKPEAKAPPPAHAPPEDGVARISTSEAHDLIEKGKAIIVDVRGEDSYRIGHIKGALWMPDVAQRIKELPRDKMIVTYCS
jgi:3-mercaptopyruvate sulfurtransferase SseA